MQYGDKWEDFDLEGPKCVWPVPKASLSQSDVHSVTYKATWDKLRLEYAGFKKSIGFLSNAYEYYRPLEEGWKGTVAERRCQTFP